MKGEFALLISALQTLQEEPAEQAREHVNGEKET
jgi:hypothetical protein